MSEACPECGSADNRNLGSVHRQCEECYQEWFTDIVYKKEKKMGLSIIDALKSGKNFRRKLHNWGMLTNNACVEYTLDKEDILATDWEIEERKIEITESEFDEAWKDSDNKTNSFGLFRVELKKRLFEK